MGYVVTFAAVKGGSGKTILSSSFADCLHGFSRKKNSILGIDTDPQRSLETWHKQAVEQDVEQVPVVSCTAETLVQAVQTMRTKFDIVVIDTPGVVGDNELHLATKAAMAQSDLVVIPVSCTGGVDVWALDLIMRAFQEVKLVVNPNVDYGVVFNKFKPNTTLAKGIVERVTDDGLTTFETKIHDRVTYGEAHIGGRGPMTYDVKSAAAKEIHSLTKEIIAVLKEKRKNAA